MTFKYYLILLSCFILKQGLVAQIVPPPATQSEVDAGANRFKYVTPYTLANRAGGGGTLTGSVWFPGPFTVSGTNWYLNATISNYALAPAITNLTGPSGSNKVLIAATGTRATNAFKRYYFDTNVAHILSNVVASASSGDVVELGAGDFRIGVQTIRVPVGVTLKGQGMRRTFLIGDVGVATNSIVQIMSTNVIEDLTIVANKKSSYFQYPIGNNMIFGHPAATNVTLRRVHLDGETDCLLISQSNRVSITIENCEFRSAWDVCNLLDLDTGDGVPGITATIRDSILYSDSATAQLPASIADPKSQPLIVSGALVDLITSVVTATNHKAISLSLQGFETNLVYITDTIFRSAGTNGYGKQIDISTDSDVSVSKAVVSSQRIQDSDVNGSSGVTYLPAQTGSLRASTFRSLDDIFATDGLFGRTATITNELQAQTVNTTDLNSTGSAVLKDVAVDSLTMALATASRVARIDANGNITNVVSGSPSTEYVKADGTTGTPSGGGGTNFPNVNLLVGGTNLTLSAGVRKAYHNQTNGSHGINLNLAVPESGYEVVYSVSNSGSSDITVTFYTNSVASNFYDIASKTNVNTFTAAASAITEAKLKFIGGGIWILERTFGPEAVLKFGTGIWSDTNGANGLDITPFTRRYTNYASASITINCATDVTANYTNAVAANNTITLATPVIGTSGSLGLVSDGSARTLAILAPVAITWLSTNDTATATNILTTASKRSLFAWRVGLGTDGVSTNIHCWVKNQTP